MVKMNHNVHVHTVGSWFPSSYYGHFRSKTRSDFINEYRQISKPQPPPKFVRRSQEKSSRHVFSRHDNRHSFLNDALYFEEGLGKKKIPNETQHWKPDFMAWMPHKPELDKAGPKHSSYRTNFLHHSEPLVEKYVKRPKTAFEDVPTTTYRYSHGEANPNKELLSAMTNNALLSTVPNRICKASKITGRESVASCMSWQHTPTPPKVKVTRMSQSAPPINRSIVPAATQTSTATTTTTTHKAPGVLRFNMSE